MTAPCYDVLNQVLFDKTLLSTSVFIVSPVSPSTKGRLMICERVSAVRCLGLCSGTTRSSVRPTSWGGGGCRVTRWTVEKLNPRNVNQGKDRYQLHLVSRRIVLNRVKRTSSNQPLWDICSE